MRQCTIFPDRYKVETNPKREENVLSRFHKFSKNTCNENIEIVATPASATESTRSVRLGEIENNEKYCATRVRGENTEKVLCFRKFENKYRKTANASVF